MMDVIAVEVMVFYKIQQNGYKTWIRSVVDNVKAMIERFKINKIDIVSNGTDNHLAIIDLKNLVMADKQVTSLLDRCHIMPNKTS